MNSFSFPTTVTVTQQIPAVFAIIDAGGAQTTGQLLTWSRQMNSQTATRFYSVLRWTGSGVATLDFPGPLLRFTESVSSANSDFAGQISIVKAPWPLQLNSLEVTNPWPTKHAGQIKLVIGNSLADSPAQGQLSLKITDPGTGDILWQQNAAFSIAAAGSQNLNYGPQLNRTQGVAWLEGSATVGSENRQLISEFVEIRDHMIYLPLIIK